MQASVNSIEVDRDVERAPCAPWNFCLHRELVHRAQEVSVCQAVVHLYAPKCCFHGYFLDVLHV